MTTKKPHTPLPKRPAISAPSAAHNSPLLPFALGCSFPLAATILDIFAQGLPFSLGSIVAVQQAQPLHWLLDLVPVAMLCLPIRKKRGGRAPARATQQPGMRESTTTSTADSSTKPQKAISTLQDELTSLKTQLDQVRTREQTLITLLDSAKDAILALTPEGQILSVNQGAEEMLGWTRQEMVGHPINNLLSLPSVPRLEEHLALLLSDPAAPTMIDLEFVHSNGTGLWVEGCSSVMRDAANRPTSFLVIYRDLSHRQQQPAHLHTKPRDTVPYPAVSYAETRQHQSPLNLQTDRQPSLPLSLVSEASPSEALPKPECLPHLTPIVDSFSEREATLDKATPAFAPSLAESDLHEHKESEALVQFSFVDNESGRDTRETPGVPTSEFLTAETTESSQPVFSFSSPRAGDDSGSEPQQASAAPPLFALIGQPKNETPASVSAFNFSEALANIGDDETLLAELATIFLEEYPEVLNNVRTAVENNDEKALVYFAHALKGSVSNFVARDAENAARKLEQIGREGDLADAPQVLEDLETALSRLAPALNALAVQKAA